MIDMGGVVNVSVVKLAERCNPFESHCWCDLKSPITRDEVQHCIDDQTYLIPNPDPDSIVSGRQNHMRLIAWFVEHGWVDPIGVDVGIPGLCHVNWLIQDGNHRFAAAIFRGDITIAAGMQGSVKEIQSFV